MESGLRGRNNGITSTSASREILVSMESGLRGRNNTPDSGETATPALCLNGVRPKRPEQWVGGDDRKISPRVSMESGLRGRNNVADVPDVAGGDFVSMESGLRGRNNHRARGRGVRAFPVSMESGLRGRNNPSRTASATATPLVSMESGLRGRNNGYGQFQVPYAWVCLNGVRPKRPEQCRYVAPPLPDGRRSQWSPA